MHQTKLPAMFAQQASHPKQQQEVIVIDDDPYPSRSEAAAREGAAMAAAAREAALITAVKRCGKTEGGGGGDSVGAGGSISCWLKMLHQWYKGLQSWRSTMGKKAWEEQGAALEALQVSRLSFESWRVADKQGIIEFCPAQGMKALPHVLPIG
jgi:hypothetical protein